jgi:hypothetical protein
LLKEEVKPAERYWVTATLAEAYRGIGDEAKYQEVIAKATAAAPERWMVDTTLQQIQRLRMLQSTSTAATA